MFQEIFHHDDTSDGQNAKLHSSLQLPLPLGRCWWLESNKHRQASALEQKCEVVDIDTLLGTNISPTKAVLKMISLFPRWDMLVPWRVFLFSMFWYAFDGFRNLAINHDLEWIKPYKTREWVWLPLNLCDLCRISSIHCSEIYILRLLWLDCHFFKEKHTVDLK